MREERENESKTIEKSFSSVPVPVVVSLLFSVRLIQVPQNKWRQQYVVWINKERAERERERGQLRTGATHFWTRNALRALLYNEALLFPLLNSSPVWPDLRKFRNFAKRLTSLWQNFDGLFLIWQNVEPTLANLWLCWANFQCYNWQILKNNLTIWSHWIRQPYSSKVAILVHCCNHAIAPY